MSKSKNIFRQIYDWVMEFSDQLDDNHTYMLASGIAFNIALYIIPLFLLSIYLVNAFVDTNSLIEIIEKALKDFMPPTQSSREIIHTVIDEVMKINLHSNTAGIIGLVSLLWISSILVSSLRSGLNAIFHIPAKKIFIIYRLYDILITVIITILILIYSYFVPIGNFLISLLESYFPEFVHKLISGALVTIISLVSSFVIFMFIYTFIPTKRLPFFVIFWSTVVCVLMIELSRHIFAWYISSISNYGKFYGTFAVVISMAIWIYYSSFILLFSGELMNFIYKKKNISLPPQVTSSEEAGNGISQTHPDTEIEDSPT